MMSACSRALPIKLATSTLLERPLVLAHSEDRSYRPACAASLAVFLEPDCFDHDTPVEALPDAPPSRIGLSIDGTLDVILWIILADFGRHL